MSAETESVIHLEARKAWNGSALLFIIGPGAAGKSTLGRALATHLQRKLIDLDDVFLERVGDISLFIREAGYEAYKARNSVLARTLVNELTSPTVFVTSSGFLTTDNPPEILAANEALLKTGYSLSLLPTTDLEDAVRILVARQMTRTFNAGIAKEESRARERFGIYQAAGDLLVCSTANPNIIARKLMPRLTR